jgi:hypothetical protein
MPGNRKSRRETKEANANPEKTLHDLVLSETASGLDSLHGLSAVGKVGVADMRQAKRATSILVSREFGCATVRLSLKFGREHIPIEVTASSNFSNWTTPVPRERPLASYWISARATFPIVLKSSTKSSLLVDHGSYMLLASCSEGKSNSTYIANVDDLRRLAARSRIVGEVVGRVADTAAVVATSGGRRCATEAASESATGTTKASAKSTTSSSESTTSATEASAESSTGTTKASTATKATTGSSGSEAVFANLKLAALPIVAVELLDCSASVIR